PMTPYRTAFARGTSHDPWADLADEHGEVIEQVDRHLTGVFAEAELSSGEVDQIMQAARATPDVDAWTEQSERWLKQTYGAQRDAVVREANAYVEKLGIGRLLRETGLGSHPAVVEMIVAKAR